MKTFEEVLQNEDAILVIGNKWLGWSRDAFSGWVVYKYEYGRLRLVIETEDKEEAIKKLVDD